MKPLIHFTELSTPLGKIVLTATPRGLSGLYFHDQRWFPSDQIRSEWRRDDLPFSEARAWLEEYFQGRVKAFTATLDPQGTSFQHQVWKELLAIPRGETCTYSQIAHRLGSPRAVRAVGAAIGRNPISLIIPCHRVVGVNGSLTGYAGGLVRKQRLLELERLENATLRLIS